MKNSQIAVLVLCATFVACNFNQSAGKDFTTGAYSRGMGIDCDEVIIQASGKTGKDNQFVYGETVNFVFENVKGFQKEGKKVFPGLSLFITRNEKDTVLAYADLLDNIKGGTELSPLQLQANFIAALPHKNNEKYNVHITIWDKKGEGNFSYDLPFTVEESELLSIHSVGMDYQNIYLWNESKKQPVLGHKVQQEDELMLLLEGLNGLVEKNGSVYPVLSLELKDHTGSTLLSNPNMLSEFEQEGNPANDITKEQFYINIEFTEGYINNPCELRAVIKDKYADNYIEMTTELNIQ